MEYVAFFAKRKFIILFLSSVFLFLLWMLSGLTGNKSSDSVTDMGFESKITYKNFQSPTIMEQDNTKGELITWKEGKWTKVSSQCDIKDDFRKGILKYPAGTTIFVHPPAVDVHVSNAILTRGGYEENYIKTLSSYLNKYPNSVFLDIGANIGVYSISLASLGHRVISIECLDINVNRLCASMRYPKKRPLNMTIIVNAASFENTKVGIHKWKGDRGGTYIDSNIENADLTIDTIMVDNILDIYDIKEAILKIDVEKSEDKVLKGSYKFFEKVLVHAVLLEFNKHVNLDSGTFIVEFLKSHGLQPQVAKNIRNNHKLWKSQNILFLRE